MPDSAEKYHEDEALVRLASDGDDAAMAQLIAFAMPIAKAKAVAQQAKNDRLSAEDLIQEGMLGFLNAVNTYSADKNTSFRTYADVCIGNRIISAVRSHNNIKNYSLTSAVPISEDDDTLEHGSDPQNIILERESYEEIKEFIKTSSVLSAFERQVVELRLSGLSYKLIANRLGTDSKAIDNALVRVRKKMHSKF